MEQLSVHTVLDALEPPFLYLDLDKRILYASPTFREEFGIDDPSLSRKELKEIFDKVSYQALHPRIDRTIRTGRWQVGLLKLKIREHLDWFRVRIWPDLTEEGGVCSLYLSFEDARENLVSRRRLKCELALLRVIRRFSEEAFEQTSADELATLLIREIKDCAIPLGLSVCRLNEAGELNILNEYQPSLRESRGDLPLWSAEEGLLLSIRRGEERVFDENHVAPRALKALLPHALALLLAPIKSQLSSPHFLLFAAPEGVRWTYPLLNQLRHLSNIYGRALRASVKVAHLRTANQFLKERASTDSLTGVSNRSHFLARLDQALRQAQRNKRPLGLMWVDLDNFKEINDRLGHDTGDQVLKEFSSRLQQVLRSSDTLGRFGGDEFVIVLPEIARPEDASIIAEKLIEAVEEPILVLKEPITLSISIGISFFPIDSKDPEVLLQKADAAMYEAKKLPGSSYRYCSSGLSDLSTARAEMRVNLKDAFRDHRFLLHYQPIVNLDRTGLWAVEALLRWKDDERSNEKLTETISQIEAAGLSMHLFAWVLQTAFRDFRSWNSSTGGRLRLSINLGRGLISRPETFDLTKELLSRSGFNPDRLILESLESDVMEIQEANLTFLRELAELGISLMIDDFCEGVSSISQLAKLPISGLKLSPEIVHGFSKNGGGSERIARATISMAHSLDLILVGEAVESPKQLDKLASLECDKVQGFLVGRPAPPDEVSEMISRFQGGSY